MKTLDSGKKTLLDNAVLSGYEMSALCLLAVELKSLSVEDKAQILDKEYLRPVAKKIAHQLIYDCDDADDEIKEAANNFIKYMEECAAIMEEKRKHLE